MYISMFLYVCKDWGYIIRFVTSYRLMRTKNRPRYRPWGRKMIPRNGTLTRDKYWRATRTVPGESRATQIKRRRNW